MARREVDTVPADVRSWILDQVFRELSSYLCGWLFRWHDP